MSIENTVRNTINLIRYFKDRTKSAIIRSTRATVNVIKDLPQYLNRLLNTVWSACRLGISLGKACCKLPFKLAKYVVQNFGQCLNMLWRTFTWGFRLGRELIWLSFKIAKYVVQNFQSCVKNFCLLLKDIVTLIYKINKAIIMGVFNNFAALSRWFLRNALTIVSEIIGITLGILIAPIEIIYDIFKPIIKGINSILTSIFGNLIRHIAKTASLIIGITLGIIIAPFEMFGNAVDAIFGRNSQANNLARTDNHSDHAPDGNPIVEAALPAKSYTRAQQQAFVASTAQNDTNDDPIIEAVLRQDPSVLNQQQALVAGNDSAIVSEPVAPRTANSPRRNL